MKPTAAAYVRGHDYPDHRATRCLPLSPMRLRILGIIAASIRTKGFAPALRDIAAAVDIASFPSVKHHLNILEYNNYIVVPRLENGNMISHSIQLTPAGWEAVPEELPAN